MKWADIPAKYKPHWSTWKIEGTPMEQTQKMLHAKGLHDPWLRNEVWIYKIRYPKFPGLLARGIIPGFFVFLGALAVEKTWFSSGDEHH